MSQVRIQGDPFGEEGAASLMRSFLRLALASGVRCSLSLAAVEPRPPLPGERAIALSDGGCVRRVATRLPPAETRSLLRAAGVAVAATVPVVVFAPAARRADAVRAAGLAWPRATAVVAARDGVTAQELLERVRAESRWAGREDPPHALDELELTPWLHLPAPGPGPIVAVGDGTFASGLDLAVAAWRQQFARGGPRLRLVVDGGHADTVAALRASLGAAAAFAEVIAGPFQPEHVRDAAAVLLPFRRLPSPRLLVLALASGRPVCVSHFAASAPLLTGRGICLPIGGRNVDGDGGPYFAPAGPAIASALHRAVGELAAAHAIGMRARVHVLAELTCDRPASPPPAVHRVLPARPVLVLEAPFFAGSAPAEVAIAMAQALVRRDRADVRLVATVPARVGLAELRERAPELVARLCRDPGVADLWLCDGEPLRAARPPCRSWALRVDLDHGALPLELTPHVSQDADVIVVPGEHALRALTAAGRSAVDVKLVPPGAGAEMHAAAAADAHIVAWKEHRAAVLFAGGPDWLGGADVFLRAVLGAHHAGAPLAVVVRIDRRDTTAAPFGELLERFRRTAGTPPLLVIDRELSRAELAGVYTACDLLLHPYRGGGFCQPVLDARACGLPVLATAGGAMAQSMAGPGAALIPSVRRDAELAEAHASTPWVVEPSAAHAQRLLAAMLAELPVHRHLARALAPAVRASFSWDAAAAVLEELAFAAMARRCSDVRAGEPVVALSRANARSSEPARA